MSDVAERIVELLGKLQSIDFFEREAAVKELGACRQDEAVAGLVLAIEDPDPGIRERAADCLIEIKGAVASGLLCRFLAHPDIGTRNLASEILVQIGSEAVPSLVEHLGSDDADVRKFATDILGLIRDARAVEPLCRVLWDESSNVVCSAAEALGEIGAASAAKSLIAACSNIEDVRLPAVEALGKIGGSAALAYLHSLTDCGDPVLRYAVVDAIGVIGNESSLQKLLPGLQSADPTIAEACLDAVIAIAARTDTVVVTEIPLERFATYLFGAIKRGHKQATEFTLKHLSRWHGLDAARNLLDVVDYLDDDKFGMVAQRLAELGAPAIPIIVEKLQTVTKDTKLRLLDVLKQFPVTLTTVQLLHVVHDVDPEVRQKATHLLGISGDNTVLPALKLLTQDANGHVRAAAYSAIGWLASASEIEFLFVGLDDKYQDVREAAAGALIVIGGPKVVAKFTADLYHPVIDRQRLAAMAFGWIGEPEVVESLLRAANHPDASIRKTAITALGRIGQNVHPAAIVQALNDENSAVRKAAITTLAQIEGPEAINHIRMLLEDPDVWVRYHAISAIGESQVETNAKYLIGYLEDPQDIIRIAASRALANLGAQHALPALKRLQDERNKDLVTAATRAANTLGIQS